MLDVKLLVVGGATENDEFELELPAVFGRARESSIPLPHPLVSRQHCELFEREGRLLVRDLGSTNGTFVGRDRIADETVLEHGQLLTIGTVTFRACLNDQPFHGNGHMKPTAADQDAAERLAESDTDTTAVASAETRLLDARQIVATRGQAPADTMSERV
jgi:predicted component of type VI protein secretion system